ncbi:hypothetical protein [Motiliproteus sp. MSK22-1]|uniref:hypothetical protein n=1 Tax=Motiliproteus sp. MSK22-1 TaxID=1897630 RepID=UPI0009758908|nr:hypothetical protein [Motiliproteus sp. MSK22-1]OMH31785.1 hypothetical protein BGP75_16860 [Motiliproteus sp. MSK22-1]
MNFSQKVKSTIARLLTIWLLVICVLPCFDVRDYFDENQLLSIGYNEFVESSSLDDCDATQDKCSSESNYFLDIVVKIAASLVAVLFIPMISVSRISKIYLSLFRQPATRYHVIYCSWLN